MEIEGRITQVMPTVSGISQKGNQWKKQDFVIETLGQYPRKICMELFGDKVDQYPVSVGQNVKVGFDIESREYNGRWYTSVSAWKIEPVGHTGVAVPPPPVAAAPISGDDLPF